MSEPRTASRPERRTPAPAAGPRPAGGTTASQVQWMPPSAGPANTFRASGGSLPPIARPRRTTDPDCGCPDVLVPFRCIR